MPLSRLNRHFPAVHPTSRDRDGAVFWFGLFGGRLHGEVEVGVCRDGFNYWPADKR